MNRYFKIDDDDVMGKGRTKLINAGIELNPKITNQIVVDAQFKDIDQLGYDFQRLGQDVKIEISNNDTEKTFNYILFNILKEQTDEDAKVGNLSRSWGPLKSAIRIWMKRALSESESIRLYKIFINDISKGASSKFRPAITSALKEYRPILTKILADKAKNKERREVLMFSIKPFYYFTDDYADVPQSLCALDKFYIIKKYDGRDNELRFKDYIDSKIKHIEWWFKNGDSGKDFFAIRYLNTTTNDYALFYPDWIIHFKDGRIGIFDTKKGDTAIDTEGRAVALANKIKELGKDFVGGIAVFENGVWYYNSSPSYTYSPGKLDKNWKPMENLFNSN